MRGVRVLDGKIGYKDIPKTACTAIKEELYRVNFGKAFNDSADINDPNNKYAIHQDLLKKSRLLGNINDCEFKFVVIRDPVKRFLSAYSSRVVFHQELSREYLSSSPRDKHLMRFLPKLNPSLNEFVDNLIIYTNVSMISHHTSPFVVKLEGKNLNYFDKVYKFENLSELEKDLSKKLDKKFKLEHRHESKQKTSLSDLSYSRLKFVINYYHEDYKLLKDYYTPDDIWSEWLEKAGAVDRLEFRVRRVVSLVRKRASKLLGA